MDAYVFVSLVGEHKKRGSFRKDYSFAPSIGNMERGFVSGFDYVVQLINFETIRCVLIYSPHQSVAYIAQILSA